NHTAARAKGARSSANKRFPPPWPPGKIVHSSRVRIFWSNAPPTKVALVGRRAVKNCSANTSTLQAALENAPCHSRLPNRSILGQHRRFSICTRCEQCARLNTRHMFTVQARHVCRDGRVSQYDRATLTKKETSHVTPNQRRRSRLRGRDDGRPHPLP